MTRELRFASESADPGSSRSRLHLQPRHPPRDSRSGLRHLDPELDRGELDGEQTAREGHGHQAARREEGSRRNRQPARLRPGARLHRDRRLVQLETADDVAQLRGEGRPDRLLDVLLHQLPPHAAASWRPWYDTYHSQGLEIIGVHTPEFAFEHVASNVKAAVKRLGIPYPVVQDNNYATWDAYGNQYWPAEFLIDKTGHIRHTDFGEGGYGQTEQLIRQLLGAKGHMAPAVPDLTPTDLTTPESYLGYERLARYTGSLPVKRNKLATYTFPKIVGQNDLAYSGQWNVQSQRIVAGADARLRLNFTGMHVYLVLGGHGTVQKLIDGKPAGIA